MNDIYFLTYPLDAIAFLRHFAYPSSTVLALLF